MRRSSLLTSVLFLIVLFLSTLSYSTGFAQELQWKTVEQSRSDSYQSLDQILKNLPEWDGIYIVTKTGYIEVSTRPWCEKLLVPANEFLGFLVKGKDYVEGFKFVVVDRYTCQTAIDGGPSAPRTVFPVDPTRKKAVAPDAYFFTVTDPIGIFGTVERNSYVSVFLDERRTHLRGFWYIGLSESGGTSSFGNVKK